MNTGTLTRHWMPLTIDGTDVRLSCISREGTGLPIVFLHGFGSTKEDYADVALQPAFDGRPVFAYDAPGCGESECGDLDRYPSRSWLGQPCPNRPNRALTGSAWMTTPWAGCPA